MKNPLGGGNGMVPHYSGTTLDAQRRYSDGVKEILENYFFSKPQNPANVIVGKSAFSLRSLFTLKTSNTCFFPEGYETPSYGQR